MKLNQELLDMIASKKNELPVLDELNFSDDEICINYSNLIKYITNNEIHQNSKHTCDANHFDFFRDSQNVINTRHYFCNKQAKINRIKENIIISDYENNSDYQEILNDNSEFVFMRTEKRKKFIKYVKNNYFKDSDEQKVPNCFIYGDTLSGKSFAGFYLLACCLHFKQNKKLAYINIKNFCNKIADSFSNQNNSKEQLNKYIDTLLNVDYLFIDEIGTEKHSPSSFSRFGHIIKERTKSKAKTTILISSKNITKLKNYYIDTLNNDLDYINDVILRIKEIAKENEIEIDKVI